MRNLRPALALAAALSLLLATVAIGDQDLRLTKKLKDISTTARIAIGPDGNILVAFTQLKINDGSFGRVWVVLLKLLPDGTYKVKKAQMLSADSGWHGRAYPAYISDIGRFLVVWDTADPTVALPASKIMARWVKRTTGKAIGAAFALNDDKGMNVNPVVFNYRVRNGTTPTLDDPVYGVVRTRYRTADTLIEPDGNFGLQLDLYSLNGDKPMWEVATQLEPIVEQQGYQLTAKAYYAISGRAFTGYQLEYAFGVTVIGDKDVYDGPHRTTAGFINGYVVDQAAADNLRVGLIQFPLGSMAPSKVSLGYNEETGKLEFVANAPVNGDFSVNWRLYFPSEQTDSRQTKVFKKVDGVFDSVVIRRFRQRIDFAPGENAAPAAKEAVAHQVSASNDGWVYRRILARSPAGKPKATGAMIKVFEHKNRLQEMTARTINLRSSSNPVSEPANNVIVVWQKKIRENKHELRAYLFSVK